MTVLKFSPKGRSNCSTSGLLLGICSSCCGIILDSFALASRRPAATESLETGATGKKAYARLLIIIMGLCSFPQYASRADGYAVQKETPGLLARMLAGPMKDAEEIVVVERADSTDGHWYANFGYHCHNPDRYVYSPCGGKMLVLDLRTGKTRTLIDDPEGSIRDPFVDYDGRTVLFSYRPGGTHNYHLYTIGRDGGNLKQLTRGNWNDYEPCFMPDGGIMFVSSRCYRWVPCWYTSVGVMYRCERDGSRVRQISFGVEHENHPWMLPDGRVAYTRWEYVDRHTNGFHHLWTVNPDGTGQMVLYGNLAFGRLFIDAKPVPGSRQIACIVSPGHGKSEHQGDVLLIDPHAGPSNAKAQTQLNMKAEYQVNRHTIPAPCGERLMSWRDVLPFSEDCFLVCNNDGLFVMDGHGDFECIYRSSRPAMEIKGHRGRLEEIPIWVHEPRVLAPRPKENLIPAKVDESKTMGVMILSDIYRGREMEGVERGAIKKLLVMEELPKPVSFNWAPSPYRTRQVGDTGTIIMHRVLGTVPVEKDGSAHFEVPANRAIFFSALDENNITVKRMQSFVSVMAGESVSCVGCHESRLQAPHDREKSFLSSVARPPSRIKPVPGVPESGLIDFPRDIQPVLDKYCVECHNAEKSAGNVRLDGARNPYWTFGYSSLIDNRQLGMSGHYYQNVIHGNSPPRSFGSPVSELLKKASGKHHGKKVDPENFRLLATWIDSSAAFAGTYVSLVLPEPQYPRIDRGKDTVLHRKCASCHFPSVKRRNMWPFDKHSRIDIGKIQRSFLLRAPLSKEAGGLQLCRERPARSSGKHYEKSAESEKPMIVFETKDDPGYVELEKMIRGCLDGSASGGRAPDILKPAYWQPGFVPDEAYIREMKRYGVLDPGWEPGTPTDWFELEEKYFMLFRTEEEKRRAKKNTDNQ